MSQWNSSLGEEHQNWSSHEMSRVSLLQERLKEWGLESYVAKFVQNGLTKIDEWTKLDPEDICDNVGILLWGHRQNFVRNLEKLKAASPPWNWYKAEEQVDVFKNTSQEEVISQIPRDAVCKVIEVSPNGMYAYVNYWEKEGVQAAVVPGWVCLRSHDQGRQALDSLIDDELYGLEINIKSANALEHEDKDGLGQFNNDQTLEPEAYVQFNFQGKRSDVGTLYRTRTAETGRSPVWEERFVHHYISKNGQRDIILTVMDKDEQGWDQDDVIGYCKLSLRNDLPLRNNEVGRGWSGEETIKNYPVYESNRCTGASKGTLKVGIKRKILGKLGARKESPIQRKNIENYLREGATLDEKSRGLDAIRYWAHNEPHGINSTLTQYDLKEQLIKLLRSPQERIAADASGAIRAIAKENPLILYDLGLTDIFRELQDNLEVKQLAALSEDCMKDIVGRLKDERVVKVSYTIRGMEKNVKDNPVAWQDSIKAALVDDIAKIGKQMVPHREEIRGDRCVLETRPQGDDSKLKRSERLRGNNSPVRLDLFVKASSRDQAEELRDEINDKARPDSLFNFGFEQRFPGTDLVCEASVPDELLSVITEGASNHPEETANLLVALFARDGISANTGDANGILAADIYWEKIENLVPLVLNKPGKRDNTEVIKALQAVNPELGDKLAARTVIYEVDAQVLAKRNGMFEPATIVKTSPRQVKVRFTTHEGGLAAFNKGDGNIRNRPAQAWNIRGRSTEVSGLRAANAAQNQQNRQNMANIISGLSEGRAPGPMLMMGQGNSRGMSGPMLMMGQGNSRGGTFNAGGAQQGNPHVTPNGVPTPGNSATAGGAHATPGYGATPTGYENYTSSGKAIQTYDDYRSQMQKQYTGGGGAYPAAQYGAGRSNTLLQGEAQLAAKPLGLFSALSSSSSRGASLQAQPPAQAQPQSDARNFETGNARMNAWTTLAGKVPVSAIFNTTSSRRGPRKLSKEHARLIVAQFRGVPKRNVSVDDKFVKLLENKTKKEMQRFLQNMPIMFYPWLQGVKTPPVKTQVLGFDKLIQNLSAVGAGSSAQVVAKLRKFQADLIASKNAPAGGTAATKPPQPVPFQFRSRKFHLINVIEPTRPGGAAEAVIKVRTGDSNYEHIKSIASLLGKRNPDKVFERFANQKAEGNEPHMDEAGFRNAVKALGLTEIVLDSEVTANFKKYCQMKRPTASMGMGATPVLGNLPTVTLPLATTQLQKVSGGLLGAADLTSTTRGVEVYYPQAPSIARALLAPASGALGVQNIILHTFVEDTLLNSMEFQYALTELRNNAVFETLDANGDKMIDVGEFKKGMRLIGNPGTDAELEAQFNEAQIANGMAGSDMVMDHEELANHFDKYQFAQGVPGNSNQQQGQLQFVIPSKPRKEKAEAHAYGGYTPTPGGYTRGQSPPPPSRRESEPRPAQMNNWTQDETIKYLKYNGIKPHTAQKIALRGRQLKSLTRQDLQQMGVRSYADVLKVKRLIDDAVTRYEDGDSYNFGFGY